MFSESSVIVETPASDPIASKAAESLFIPLTTLQSDLHRLQTVGTPLSFLLSYQILSYLKFEKGVIVSEPIYQSVKDLLKEAYHWLSAKGKAAINLGELEPGIPCSLKAVDPESKQYIPGVTYIGFISDFAERYLLQSKKSLKVEVVKEC